MKQSLFAIIPFFFTILAFSSISAQKLPGRWEGIMNDEILQLNIVQGNNQLCGYSYDYKIDNPDDHCKAYFTGTFDREFDCWVLSGYRFIENSGTHIFMEIRVRAISVKGNTLLRGVVLPKSSPDAFDNSSAIEIELRKTYISPSELSRLKDICFPKDDDPRSPEKKRKSDPEKGKEKPAVPVAPVLEQKGNEPVKNAVPEIVNSLDSDLLKDMSIRKKTEFSHLVVNTPTIKLQVYDNGIVDNDTVSIFYNKQLLVNRQKLSEKPIEINLQLDDSVTTHELIMYAENLGSIPPNTALIVVTAGDKRYELHSSASLEENAVLVFEYHPK